MPFKLIHVGVGGRGGHWLEFIAGQSQFQSVACVDVDLAALEKFAARTGCPTFTDLTQALAQTKADGVIISSPSLLHGRQATLALDAGFAVMVEKPLAPSLAEAVELVERAKRLRRPLMVAENYRFFQAERTLRKALGDELIGKVLSAVCIDRRNQPSTSQGGWVKSMEQPFLTEIAVHHFDSFRYLFGHRPRSLWAETFNPQGSDYERNAAAETFIEMEGGLPVQYSGSFVGSRYEYSLWIRGELGELRTDRSKVWHRKRGESTYREVPPVAMPEGEPLRYPHAGMLSLLNQFRAAVLEGVTPETSGADNLWTLAMFEAAIRSSGQPGYVSIDSVLTQEMRTRAGILGEIS
jgi:predicted dehydrogenase